MITNKNWNILKQYWGESFLYGNNKIDFQKYGFDNDYTLQLKQNITNFEEEVELNFLSITNGETRDNYISILYNEINTRIRLNGEYAEYIIRNEKHNSEAILNLLRYQSDALFGLTLWFKMNLLFEKALKEESLVLREDKFIDTNDNRIKGKLTKAEIEKYFKDSFSAKQKDQNPILTEEQIKQFLHSNFANFSPIKEVVKFDTPNTNQTQVRKIIYNFYKKHKLKNRTDDYVNLLKNNFSTFDSTTFESEKANFNK